MYSQPVVKIDACVCLVIIRDASSQQPILCPVVVAFKILGFGMSLTVAVKAQIDDEVVSKLLKYVVSTRIDIIKYILI